MPNNGEGPPELVQGTRLDGLGIFRRSLGINSDLSSTGVKDVAVARRQNAVGLYRDVLNRQRAKWRQGALLSALIYAGCLAEIAISAVMTALGPTAGDHTLSITILGAMNTIVAGVLALIEGHGLLDKLRSDEMEFRRLRCWIEETEVLLAVEAVGKDKAEVESLVKTALKKYNYVRTRDENHISLAAEGARHGDVRFGARAFVGSSANTYGSGKLSADLKLYKCQRLLTPKVGGYSA